MTLLHTVLNIFDVINYIKNKHNLLSFSVPSVLFCAAKVSSTRFSVSPLIFDHLIAQRGQIYNKSHGYFNPPTKGIYVFHLSSGLLPGVGVVINLITSPPSTITCLYYSATSYDNFDTTSVDYIGTLAANVPIYFNVQSGTAGSDSLRQTSWSAFLLDSIMFPLIAF